MIIKYPYNRYIYFGGLILLSGALSLSEYILSVSMFILFFNWILEGNFHQKRMALQRHPSLLVFPIFFILALSTLLYSQNQEHALNVLRLWLPLFFLPVLIGTSPRLTYKELKWILCFFVAGVFISTLISTGLFMGIIENDIHTTRQLSYFYSPIRFSLILVLAVFICGYFFWKTQSSFIKYEKYIALFLALWFTGWIFILGTLTGFIIYGVVLAGVVLYTFYQKKHSSLLILVLLSGIGAAIVIFLYSFISVYQSLQPENIKPLSQLPDTTEQGNKYYHRKQAFRVENNNYVWRYICKKELREEWNERSHIPYDSLDQKGQQLKYTLMRYMTAKNLHKDSVGVHQLTPRDIKAIEKGHTHYLYNTTFGLYPRIYELAWELNRYIKKGRPSGSLSRRLLSYQTGLQIIGNHPITGTGIGDIKDTYMQYYADHYPQLNADKLIYGHNQFITVCASMGIIGLLFFCLMLFYPIKAYQGFQNYFFTIFFAMAFLSMLNEDTLNTQIGMAFFIFFYSLFLFGYQPGKSQSEYLSTFCPKNL